MNHTDVIVIGGGAVGISAALAAAERGQSVRLFERFGIPNAQGSSHGGSRISRACLSEGPEYVPLVMRSTAKVQELESSASVTLFRRTGGAYFGPRELHVVDSALRTAQASGLEHELLDPDEAQSRFPQLRLRSEDHCLLDPAAGILLPERIIAVMAFKARERGAFVHDRDAVQGWSMGDDGRFECRAASGTYTADRAVLALGSWAAWDKEMIRAGLKLEVTRQVPAVFLPRDPAPFRDDRFPIWRYQIDAGHQYYGFPIHSEALGIKAASHHLGDPLLSEADSDLGAEEITRGLAHIRSFMDDVFVDVSNEPAEIMPCKYTNTPSGHPVVGFVPGCDSVVFAAGLSGHGFKYVGVIGEQLVGSVTEGKMAPEIQVFCRETG